MSEFKNLKCEKCGKKGNHNILSVPDQINCWLCLKCCDLWDKYFEKQKSNFLKEKKQDKEKQ